MSHSVTATITVPSAHGYVARVQYSKGRLRIFYSAKISHFPHKWRFKLKIRRFTTFASTLGISFLILSFSACDQLVQLLSDDDSFSDDSTRHEIIDSITYVIKELPIVDGTAEILETSPPQVNLHITGYLEDSCTTLHQTTDSRQDNTIHVEITTKRPIDLVCAAVITEIEHIVSLGTFEPGEYQAIVNEFSINFKVD